MEQKPTQGATPPTAFINECITEMAKHPQFLLFKRIWDAKKGKYNKIPISPYTLKPYKSSDGNWQENPNCTTSFERVAQKLRMLDENYGAAFLFKSSDPFFFLDIDNCIDENGKLSETATQIGKMLPGAAVEVSLSGKGIHIFGKAKIDPAHLKKNIPLGLELYTEKRIVALTGARFQGSDSIDFTEQLEEVVAKYFTIHKKNLFPTCKELQNRQKEPDQNLEPSLDALIDKIKSGQFDNKIKALWDAEEIILQNYYPSATDGSSYDKSSADCALALFLVSEVGEDINKIDQIMRRSSLARDKWERSDYLRNTIKKAITFQQVLRSNQELQGAAWGTRRRERREGKLILSLDAQFDYFEGCVYIVDIKKIFVPYGELWDKEQFEAVYSGHLFILTEEIDKEAEKPKTMKTASAWTAFTRSLGNKFPKASRSFFDPNFSPGEIIKYQGFSYVNTYTPLQVFKKSGDPSPFVNHVKKLLPNERDQEILLSYMAACVQYKGIKFQWAPIIQGTPGNGKTLFSRCISYAVGHVYSHAANPQDITNKFNAWILRKLFISVEDIKIDKNDTSAIEIVKRLITEGMLEVQRKGADQVTVQLFANFLFNTNHKDAIQKSKDDRRFAVFYTAQQSKEDLIKDGMGDQYFEDLYDWLKIKDGFAIVADFLSSYPINPNVNLRGQAPETSSTQDAIGEALGFVEQEILEAIQEEARGFRDGYISSVALDHLLCSIKASKLYPPRKRRDLMRALGYDWHPALKGGRSTKRMDSEDGKNPIIYATAEKARRTEGLTPQEITRDYEEAQIGRGVCYNSYK